MPTYLTPGIYIEEISTGPRPIEGVSTSTAAFIGIAPNAKAHIDDKPLRAVAINNWSQFVKEFATDKDDPSAQFASTPLSLAVFGFFQNGGSRCYIVNVGPNGSIAGSGGTPRRGIELLEEVDEGAIFAAPGYTDAASYDTLLSHCEKMRDRVAILDSPAVTDIDQLKTVATVAPTPKPRRGAAAAEGEGGGAAGGAAEPPASGGA